MTLRIVVKEEREKRRNSRSRIHCSSMIEKSQRRIVAEETSVAFIEKSKAEVRNCEIPQVLEEERRRKKVFGNLEGIHRISIRIRAENI